MIKFIAIFAIFMASPVLALTSEETAVLNICSSHLDSCGQTLCWSGSGSTQTIYKTGFSACEKVVPLITKKQRAEQEQKDLKDMETLKALAPDIIKECQ